MTMQAYDLPDTLEKHVRFLTGVSPARNYTNPQVLDEVADYIAAEFRETGAPVEFQEFTVRDETYKNVRTLFGAGSKERLVIGAHYDVCGDIQGADDNASAVAGLLAIAHRLQSASLDIPIECVAYTLEEPPFFAGDSMGSFHHAKMLKQQGVQLRGMVCLEMIGYFTDEQDSQDYPAPGMNLLYPSIGNYIAVVGRISDTQLVKTVAHSMQQAIDLPVEHLAAPALVPGIALSDHWSYWENGYHAVMITDTAFFRNPHYHEITDTPDTLDYRKMSQVVEGVYAALIHVSGGTYEEH